MPAALPHPDRPVRRALIAALAACAAFTLLGTTADPDLWGHLRFGQDILSSGALPAHDLYSFTSDRPWVNHEWLAEVAMALAYGAAGPTGLNLLRLTVIALVLALVWSRLNSLDVLLRLQLVALAGLGIVLRVHPIRPQLFSVLLFAVLLTLLARADERQSWRPLWLVPPAMALWANLHGGWIVGLGVLGVWIATRLATASVPAKRPALVVGFGAAAVLATALNPYGIELWRFIAETVRVERPMIRDWQPMHALSPAFAMLWAIPAAVAAVACTRARARVDRAHLGIVALLAAASLRVSRLDAFFTLAAVLLLAPLLSRRPEANEDATSPRGMAGRPEGGPLRPSMAGLAPVALMIVAVGVWRLPTIEMPGSIPEPEAAQYIRQHGVQGRVLTWFNWGQYAIWHFGPGLQVSMDGRRETVYTDEVTTAHLRFYGGAPEALDYPDRIGADYVWLPRSLPVVPLLQQRGWRAAFEGPVSVLLTRSPQAPPVVSTTPVRRRPFPST